MNNSDLSFDWTQARAFVVTAEEGSLTAAARVLGQGQPTIGRQISALEQDLGVTLFERVGRGVALTEAGRDLLPHAKAMSEAAARMALAAMGQSQRVSGLVRITASDVFAIHVLLPVLDLLKQEAPGLTFEIVATNDISDLLRREADIALRHVRPEQPDLIARKICDAKAGFYAARSYLDRQGKPAQVSDLNHHAFVSFGNTDELISYLKPLGVELSPERVASGSSNGLVAWDMVRRGYGVAVMSCDVAEATPGIVPLFTGPPPVLFPVWLVSHREIHTARRIRLVYDMLADQLPKRML